MQKVVKFKQVLLLLLVQTACLFLSCKALNCIEIDSSFGEKRFVSRDAITARGFTNGFFITLATEVEIICTYLSYRGFQIEYQNNTEGNGNDVVLYTYYGNATDESPFLYSCNLTDEDISQKYQRDHTTLKQDICWEFSEDCGDSTETTVIQASDTVGYSFAESGIIYETNRTFGALNITQYYPYTGVCAIELFIYSPAGHPFSFFFYTNFGFGVS